MTATALWNVPGMALPKPVSRRGLFGWLTVGGLSLAALGLVKTAHANESVPPATDGTRQPEADSGHEYPMPKPDAKTGKEFCLGVIGPATLSVAASQIAVDKATDAAARQFANFELREAVAVVAIMKDLNIPALPLDNPAQAFLENLRTTPAGAGFDRAYMAAELANHEFLRDLADSYLKNSAGNTGRDEVHARHLAALAITAFKEHVVLSKDILQTIVA